MRLRILLIAVLGLVAAGALAFYFVGGPGRLSGEQEATSSTDSGNRPQPPVAAAPEPEAAQRPETAGAAPPASPAQPPPLTPAPPASSPPQTSQVPPPGAAPPPPRTAARPAEPERQAAPEQQKPISPRALGTASVRKVQEALGREGFSGGQPDGRWGKQSDAALRAFQQAKGIAASGELDARTVAALGLDAAQLQPQGPPRATQR